MIHGNSCTLAQDAVSSIGTSRVRSRACTVYQLSTQNCSNCKFSNQIFFENISGVEFWVSEDLRYHYYFTKKSSPCINFAASRVRVLIGQIKLVMKHMAWPGPRLAAWSHSTIHSESGLVWQFLHGYEIFWCPNPAYSWQALTWHKTPSQTWARFDWCIIGKECSRLMYQLRGPMPG